MTRADQSQATETGVPLHSLVIITAPLLVPDKRLLQEKPIKFNAYQMPVLGSLCTFFVIAKMN